ncbi:MAG TPA: PilZ domain-containing protein [Chloroflexota bacterium]|nr:PilZ domain-containing protein [Chloroflexota bacterium]
MATGAVGGHEQLAHARMLEERPTAASGERLDVEDVLQLVYGGQVVNLAVGPHAIPGRVFGGGMHSPSAAQIAADLGRALGVPSELVLEGKQAAETEISAAEVLTVSHERGEVIVGLDSLPHGVEPGFPGVAEFTDATGTYYLAGEVASLGVSDAPASRPRLSLRVRQASVVQLRRFVRVPVLISPYALDVQAAPGQWRPVRGEIVDLSLGGLGLLVEEPLIGEARIRVTFELPGRFGQISVTGRVVEPPGPAEAHAGQRRGAGLAHRRGVSLDPLGIEDLRTLQRSLYHRQVELRRLAEPPPRRPRAGDDAPPGASTAKPPRWMFWRR